MAELFKRKPKKPAEIGETAVEEHANTVAKLECKNCGRQTVEAKFCIYCGYPLETPKPAAAVATEHGAETKMEGVESSKPYGSYSQTDNNRLREAGEEVDTDEKELSKQLASNYSWYIKLLDLLLGREADPGVCSELLTEYRERIIELNRRREDRIRELEGELAELHLNLQMLRAKHEAGEINSKQYVAMKLEVEKKADRLRARLSILRNPLGIKLGDAPAFKEAVERRLDRIRESGKELGLAGDTIGMVEEDLKAVLRTVDGLTENFHKLRKEIHKAELRYRLGEVNLDEYQSLKQELERRLELLEPA